MQHASAAGPKSGVTKPISTNTPSSDAGAGGSSRPHFSMPPFVANVAAVMTTRVERIKVVAVVHFVCICFALLGTFLPAAYLFYNLLLILALLWSVHCKDSVDAIHTTLAIEAAAVLFDLICIIGWFTAYNNAISIIFAILNLIVRPFALIVLQRELSDRGGGTLSFGSVYPANGDGHRQPTSYEDIDRVPTQSVPSMA